MQATEILEIKAEGREPGLISGTKIPGRSEYEYRPSMFTFELFKNWSSPLSWPLMLSLVIEQQSLFLLSKIVGRTSQKRVKVNMLSLQRVKKAFNNRIVIAVCSPAHTCREAVCQELGTICVAAVLTPTVGVMNGSKLDIPVKVSSGRSDLAKDEL